MKYIKTLVLLVILASSYSLAQNDCVVGHWEYSMGMEISPMDMNNLLQGTDTSLEFVNTDGTWWLDVSPSDRGPGEYDALYTFENFTVAYLLRSPTFDGMGDIGLSIMVSGFQPFDLLADESIQVVMPRENSLEVTATMPFINEPLVLDSLPSGFMQSDSIDCQGNLFTLRGETPVIDDAGNTIMSAITFVRSE
ncbi:MAG TPA: hypothetical protein ENK21_02285 [Trueperaceae bacterium]|nr:hypothetical protein [Trueperaceae bacterium]